MTKAEQRIEQLAQWSMLIYQFRMIQKDDRLAHFQQGKPPPEVQLQVLCEDGNETYVLPFNCFFRGDKWVGVGAGKPIEVKVIGWRLPSPPAFRRDR